MCAASEGERGRLHSLKKSSACVCVCVAEKVLSAVAVAARLALTPFIFRNALKINAKVVA